MVQTHKKLEQHIYKIKSEDPAFVPNPQARQLVQDYDGSVELVKNRARSVFMTEDCTGRSGTFMEVRRMLGAALRDQGFMKWMAEGSVFGEGNSYTHYLLLYEALSVYMAGHKDAHSKDGKARYDAAESLRGVMDIAAQKQLAKEGAAPAEEPIRNASREEVAFAKKNLAGMAKYFRAYSCRVAENMVATSDEKLFARWNVLKSAERDIRILSGLTVLEELPEEARFLIREYESLKAQITLMEKAKERGEDVTRKNKRSEKLRKHGAALLGVVSQERAG